MQERPQMMQRQMDGRPVSPPSNPAPSQPVVSAPGWMARNWWRVLLAVALVAGVTWLAFGYITTQAQLAKLNGASDAQNIVNQISRYMVLPDETPTLATVNDASKLKGQEFFANAQNGDKVLIFSNSGRALLYRPSSKKVIEYAKVDLNNAGAGTSK